MFGLAPEILYLERMYTTMNNIKIIDNILILIFFLFLWNCTENNAPETIKTNPKVFVNTSKFFDSTVVDVNRSIVRWRGTKMLRTGQHYGIVNIEKGILYLDTNQKLSGGYIIINMKSINVTDIPPDDPIPIKNITNHLNIDFNTKTFPQSKFEVTDVQYTNDTLMNLRGNLTIKDVIKNISVPAYVNKQDSHKKFIAKLVLNRFDWNVGKDANWLEKKLVDKEIYLDIELWTN